MSDASFYYGKFALAGSHDVMIFEYDNDRNIYVFLADDGEWYFVVNEISNLLGYPYSQRTHDMLESYNLKYRARVRRADADNPAWVDRVVTPAGGVLTMINHCRHPRTAARFKKWFEGVLMPMLNEPYRDADLEAEVVELRERLDEERARRVELEKQIEADSQLVRFARSVLRFTNGFDDTRHDQEAAA